MKVLDQDGIKLQTPGSAVGDPDPGVAGSISTRSHTVPAYLKRVPPDNNFLVKKNVKHYIQAPR